jgi:hypothetical protein
MDAESHFKQKEGHYQVLAVVAILTNFSLWSSLLPTQLWTIGACVSTCGLVYLALPTDFIDDNSRFGMIDDALAAVGVGVGIYLMVEANAESPMPNWALTVVRGIATFNEVNIYNAVFVFLALVILYYKDFRYTLIAINAILGMPALCFSHCAPLWGLGFTCLGWGLVSPMVPLRSAAFDKAIGPTSFLIVGVGLIVLAGFAQIPVFDTAFTTTMTIEAIWAKAHSR